MSFGRKIKRKQDLGNATKQLSKAVGVLQQLEGLNTLGDLKPMIMETHQLVTAAIEDISLLAEEQAFQRSLIDCLVKGDPDQALMLVSYREKALADDR